MYCKPHSYLVLCREREVCVWFVWERTEYWELPSPELVTAVCTRLGVVTLWLQRASHWSVKRIPGLWLVEGPGLHQRRSRRPAECSIGRCEAGSWSWCILILSDIIKCVSGQASAPLTRDSCIMSCIRVESFMKPLFIAPCPPPL